MSERGNTPSYYQLMKILEVLDKEQLDCIPTVYCAETDEYLPIDRFVFASGSNQVLETDHPYFQINAWIQNTRHRRDVTTSTYLIRYRDVNNDLTKTVVTAEDSMDALVKFRAETEHNLIYACIPNDFEPCP